MFDLKDLKHLEIMAQLNNNCAVPTEPAKLPDVVIKSDHVPTLAEKILTLCTTLRTNGFAKQADSLECKFMLYRTASTHLYRAIDEDGDDLLEFAHPEGEVDICDAGKDLGHVETLLSKHHKIVNVLNKQPTGKLAFVQAYIKQASGVIQFADITNRMSKARDDLDQLLQAYLAKRKEAGGKPTETQQVLYSSLANLHNMYASIVQKYSQSGQVDEEAACTNIAAMIASVLTKDTPIEFKNLQGLEQFLTNESKELHELYDQAFELPPLPEPLPQLPPANADLRQYVDRCAKIVNAQHWAQWFTGPTGEIASDTLSLVDFARNYFGSMSVNARSAQKALDALASGKELEGRNDIKKAVIVLSMQLEEFTQKNAQIAGKATHLSENPSILDDEIQGLTQLRDKIAEVKAYLTAVHEEKDIGDFLIEGFHRSDLSTALENLTLLLRSIDKTTLQWSKTKPSSSKDHPKGDAKFTPLFTDKKTETTVSAPVANSTSVSLKDQEIQKLTKWIDKVPTSKISPEARNKYIGWMNGQISELQAATTPEQINKLIEEDKRFEAKGLL